MAHEYSIELLYHFICDDCKNWWSYALTPTHLDQPLKLPEDDIVYCYHCGHKATMKVKDGLSFRSIVYGDE